MGRTPPLMPAAAVGVIIVVAKALLSAPRLSASPTEVIVSWLTCVSFAAVGPALMATAVPSINGWACLLVAAATLPGDLNEAHFQSTWWTALGYVLEPMYLPAVVSLVLRYPHERLTARERLLAWLTAGVAVGPRLLVTVSLGSRPDGWHRPREFPTLPLPPWWHDVLFVGVGRALTAGVLVAVAVVMVRRLILARGLARQARAPLAAISAVCAVAAAVDQLAWATSSQWLGSLHAAPIRDLFGAFIPVMLLMDLLRRRAAGAAISERVLAAAATGDLSDVQSALRDVLADESITVTAAHRAAATSRKKPDWETVTLQSPPPLNRPLLTIAYRSSSVGDPPLLEVALNAVRVGLENHELTLEALAQVEELRRSRARIVEAGIEQRRRIERDLHDGAQQQLLAAAALLAQADVTEDHAAARRLSAKAGGVVRDAIAELRRLAQGIHPAALSEGGVNEAITALCESAPLRVSVTADPRVSNAVIAPAAEAAAYFLVAEALANVMKHAPSSAVHIEVTLERQRLHVVVTDDGPGGARLIPGGGLAGLADRLGALGGSLDVHTDPCPAHRDLQGSTVTGTVPTAPTLR